MAQAVRGSSGRARPVSALGRAPVLKSSFNGVRDEREASLGRKDSKEVSLGRKDSKEASLGRKDSKEAYKGQSTSEKGIRMICEELMELQKVSADNMRKSVFENYTVFIRTSQEITDLEGEITAMNEMLQTQAALVRTLAESGASIPLSSPGETLATDHFMDDVEPTDVAKRIELLPEALDVLVAERKVDDALALLTEGEDLVARGSAGVVGLSDDRFRQLDEKLTERKEGLAAYLAEAVLQPTVRGLELRSAISALDRLGDGTRAHTLLLQSYEERLKHNLDSLQLNGTSYGSIYTTAVSQLVFSAISQASRDSVAVFGEVPKYASEIVMWAGEVTELGAAVIKQNVLMSSAAAGGLRSAVECVQIALGHCALLEERGLMLCATLSKLLRPSVEQALKANLTSVMESVNSVVAADNWTLDSSRQGLHRGTGSNLRLTTSGHHFLVLVQGFLEDLPSLVSVQLGGVALEGVAEAFEEYMLMLIKALPGQEVEEEGKRKVQMAASEDQQLSLLGNAAALVDELVAAAASKILPGSLHAGDSKPPRPSTLTSRSPELKDLRRQLQMHVETLKFHLCNGIIISLCYDDYGSKLSATTYFQIDSELPTWPANPQPTALFQSLFQKLVSVHQVAGHVLAGRERVTQLFLIRLTETFVRDLSTNPELWDLIEEDPRSLGPLGLQQYIFDMQFLTLLARNMGFLSRTLIQAISQEEDRMKEAYMADLDRDLPDPEWLQATLRETFNKLMDEWFGISGFAVRDVSDVQSVSSMRSE